MVLRPHLLAQARQVCGSQSTHAMRPISYSFAAVVKIAPVVSILGVLVLPLLRI